MGVQSKQRRQKKKVRRERRQRTSGSAGRAKRDPRTSVAPRALPVDLAIEEAVEAVYHDREGAEELVEILVVGPPIPDGRVIVARGLLRELEAHIHATASGHWRPSEVLRQIRRRIGAGNAQVAAAIIHETWQQHGSLRADPVWAEEASTIAVPGWRLDHGAPTWASDVVSAVRILGLLSHLPVLPECRSADGAAGGEPDSGVKARMLEKVRHLLSKAESTGFPEEAEACTAKAQELLSRYSVDRAALRVQGPARRRTAAAMRRIWIDDPYVAAKAQLLQAVAIANRCRSVVLDTLGLATVAGHDDDLDTVETLFTSLLVQATRQMTAAGSKIDPYGRSRTRAFRQSFLVAFAVRIGERLRQAGRASVAEGVAAHGDDLLPVLATRSSAADEAIDELFPQLKAVRVAATDGEGWLAGTVAADHAQLTTRPEVPAAWQERRV